jgi:hypothetical protein
LRRERKAPPAKESHEERSLDGDDAVLQGGDKLELG